MLLNQPYCHATMRPTTTIIVMITSAPPSPTGLQKQNYLFEDLAGIHTKDGKSSLSAVCRRTSEYKRFGSFCHQATYICANCSEEDREDILKKLLNTIKQKYEKEPEFIVQMVVISGILQWNYQIQIFWEKSEEIDN